MEGRCGGAGWQVTRGLGLPEEGLLISPGGLGKDVGEVELGELATT